MVTKRGWVPAVAAQALVQFRVKPNSAPADVLIDPDPNHAANAARQISSIVAPAPPSLPNLTSPFLVVSASSIPLITMVADSRLSSPNIGSSRSFIL